MVQVIDHSCPKHTRKTEVHKQDKRNFMSSKIQPQTQAERPKNHAKPSLQTGEDSQNLQNDALLNALISQSLLFTQSQESGRDALKSRHEHLVRLGMKEGKRTIAPLKIHMGMKKKAEQRIERKLDELRFTGMRTNSSESELRRAEKSLVVADIKKKKRVVDVNAKVDATKFKVKNGMMNIPKEVIAGVEGKYYKPKKRRAAGANRKGGSKSGGIKKNKAYKVRGN